LPPPSGTSRRPTRRQRQAEQDPAAAKQAAADAGNETEKAKAEADQAEAKAKAKESKAAVAADCAKAYISAFGALFEGDSAGDQAPAVREQLSDITARMQGRARRRLAPCGGRGPRRGLRSTVCAGPRSKGLRSTVCAGPRSDHARAPRHWCYAEGGVCRMPGLVQAAWSRASRTVASPAVGRDAPPRPTRGAEHE
jgi:hypothetical protein